MNEMTNDAAVACHRIRMTEDAGHGVWRDGDIPLDEAQYWESADERFYIERAYSATTVAELREEVERLREALDALVQAASPMVTTDFRCQSITEPNARGGQTISVDPFPLMKLRPEDMRDLKHEIERARAALTKESP